MAIFNLFNNSFHNFGIVKKWIKLPKEIRFSFVGIFNAVFAYFLYASFLFLFGENHHQIALILSWVISSFTSFLAHRHYVFRIKGNIIKQYLKCASTWVFSYLINAFLLEAFIKHNINSYLAQLAALVIAGVFTFVVFKTVAFKKEK